MQGLAICFHNNKIITDDEFRHICGLPVDDESRDLIDTVEAMRILKISRPTIWRWVKQGVLEEVYVGKQARFRRSDVERMSKGEKR